MEKELDELAEGPPTRMQLASADTTLNLNVTALTQHAQHDHSGPLGTHGLRQCST